MLMSAGLIAVWLLLERHQAFTGALPAPSYGRNAGLVAIWIAWAVWRGRQLAPRGEFSGLDRQSWIVFTVLTTVLGVTTVVGDARDFAKPEALGIFWCAGLAAGLLIVGLQANKSLTTGGVLLFAFTLIAILDPPRTWLWQAAGMTLGMVFPGALLTLGWGSGPAHRERDRTRP